MYACLLFGLDKGYQEGKGHINAWQYRSGHTDHCVQVSIHYIVVRTRIYFKTLTADKKCITYYIIITYYSSKIVFFLKTDKQ